MQYRRYEVWVPANAPDGLTAYFIEVAINEALPLLDGAESIVVDVWPAVGD